MSRGPWTQATRRLREMREQMRYEAVMVERKREELKKRGYVPRAVAAAFLHKEAVKIGEGSDDEFVMVELNVETERMK